PVLAAHEDVDALDTWGVADAMRTEVETLAAEDIKRLSRRPTTVDEGRFDWLDDAATERPEWVAAFLEMKTVWHPIGGWGVGGGPAGGGAGGGARGQRARAA